MGARDSLGPYSVIRPAFDRQLSMDGFEALGPNHLMIALLELDVTRAVEAIGRLRGQGVRVSVFAFVVRSIAVAMSEHPELNLIRHGKSFVRFEDVDVSVPVEVKTPEGHFPRQLVLRRAQARTPVELYEELEAAKEGHGRTGAVSAEDAALRRMMWPLRLVPRFVRIALLRWLMRSAFEVKRRAGTTLVTSVGKFASIPGFGFTFTTGPRAAAFAVGGVVQRPWVHEGRVCPRSVLSVSIMINHDLVDGAPAARFATRLQELLETAAGLEERRDGVRPVDAQPPARTA